MIRNAMLWMFWAVCICSFFGCDEGSFSQVVDVEIPKHDPKLAIKCTIAEGDTLLECLVSHSLKIDDPSNFRLIDDATVLLFRDGVLFAEMEYDTFTKTYREYLTMPFIAEGTYRLEVSAPEFETESAIQESPTLVPIQEIRFEEDGAILADGERGHQIDVIWSDPAEEANYYSLDIYVSDPGSDILVQRYTETLDPTIEYGIDEESLIDDTSFNGKTFTARLAISNLYDQFLEPGGKLHAVLTHMTRDGYLYSRSRELYELSRDNPFVEPVVVHSNVEGGYGIFTIERSSSKSISF